MLAVPAFLFCHRRVAKDHCSGLRSSVIGFELRCPVSGYEPPMVKENLNSRAERKSSKVIIIGLDDRRGERWGIEQRHRWRKYLFFFFINLHELHELLIDGGMDWHWNANFTNENWQKGQFQSKIFSGRWWWRGKRFLDNEFSLKY